MKVEVPEYTIEDRVEVDPERTALVIVDMQNDFVNPEGSLFVEEAPETVPVCARLLAFARESGLTVFFTQDTHYEGDPEFEIWPEHVKVGTWGWQIVPELEPGPNEIVFRKARYDGFYGTALDHEIRRRGIDTLIVCGTVANICVHYTAASAGLRWLKVIHPVDAVSAITEFDRHAALRQASWLFQATLTRAAGITVKGEAGASRAG
jgi:nicotinamidase-related amidase